MFKAITTQLVWRNRRVAMKFLKSIFNKTHERCCANYFAVSFSSLDRIDTISQAMELRRFGRYNKRTWYQDQKFSGRDFGMIIGTLIIVAIGILLVFQNGGACGIHSINFITVARKCPTISTSFNG